MEETVEEIDSQKNRNKNNKVDMLHGSLAKKLFLFALPIAASSILQQLFNSADIAVVGRFAEEGAMAAVGSNSVLVGLLVNIFVGLSVGANVVISNLFGQKREDKVETVVHTAVLFSLICGFVIMGIGLFASRSLLELIDTPEDVLERAVIYLRIYCIGIPFIILYNFGAAILRSIGDTKRPMFCLIISGIMNLCLNLLLVIVFKLGVAGVAISTVVSNVFSCSAVILILIRENSAIRLEPKKLRIDGASLLKIIKIGIPASLQSAVFSISNICLQTAINSFGSKAVGGMTAALNFESIGFYIVSSFSQAAVTFVGQNYGAGQYDRCKKILRLCLLEGIIGSSAMALIFALGQDVLIKVFTVDPEEIAFAKIRLTYIVPFIALVSTYDITGSTLRGMGKSLVPALMTVVGTVVFRLIWVYAVFPIWNSFFVLLIVYPLSWLLTGGLVVGYYLLIKKRLFANNNLSLQQN